MVKNISLVKGEYKAIDILHISFKIAPVQIILLLLLAITDGLLPTTLLAIGTAYFVDSAIAIFNGLKVFSEIYLPLIILIIIMGTISILESFYMLIEAKIKLLLERYLLPTIIEIQAKLKYRYIEDSVCQEMIEITLNEMEETFIEGLQAYIAIFKSVVGISSIIVLLITQMWWVSVFITLCSIPLLWASIWAGKKNYAAKVDSRKYERRYSYYSDNILCGREAVQERTLFGYTDEMTECYYENFQKASNIQLHVLLKTYLATKLTGIVLLMVAMITALVLIQPVILGKITPGMFMGIIAALIGLAKTLGWQLQDAVENIAESKEYMEGLTQLLSMESVDDATDLPEKKSINFEKIEFKNVIFKYPNSNTNVLNGISFTLEKGKHYAFVGANGAGKSTIIKLLIGLYDEYEGEILIDGKDINMLSQSALKSLFSIIYQDFSHYEISLKDNIILGNLGNPPTRQQIIEALSKVMLSDIIEHLPNGLETVLGKIYQEGIDMSGGQWQKIAIARSIISDAPIRILDEPTASLDPISENNLYYQFKEIMKGKTAIFISHRLASTKLVDKIFVIDDGVIVQKGRHDELVTKEGVYREMFKEQSRWYQT